MSRTVAIGLQDFEKIRRNNYFYVDKTSFIEEWWESGDDVTLITRPRRFGKTLNMSMTEYFFSIEHAGRGELFEGLHIWNNEKYRKLQGTLPVITVSFANVKENNYESVKYNIGQMMTDLYIKYIYLRDSDILNDADRIFYDRILSRQMNDVDINMSLHRLSEYLYRYHGKKVIILLDEYDTPMQEAFVGGFWDEVTGFMRSLFNATFKTNPYLERAIMTGITRVSRESVFSDLNNLKVVTTTSAEYDAAFGFTESEVFDALDECGLSEKKACVKEWYDGFRFGNHKDIYNPWSILNFIDTGKIDTYWANTSSNSLVEKLIRESDTDVKEKFEELLRGNTITSVIDEQIVYNELDDSEEAIWSMLLASGYLKVMSYEKYETDLSISRPEYRLALTNLEVRKMFEGMVSRWFSSTKKAYNGFIKAMLADDTEIMNEYMNQVALKTFSYFDTGKEPSGQAPERFYHGFVLGLMVELQNRYIITSNRESGFGRYDVMLEPITPEEDDAVIMEFKVHNPKKENSLEETVAAAKAQISQQQYAVRLVSRGIRKEKIRSYGFAFDGKNVLIG